MASSGPASEFDVFLAELRSYPSHLPLLREKLNQFSAQDEGLFENRLSPMPKLPRITFKEFSQKWYKDATISRDEIRARFDRFEAVVKDIDGKEKLIMQQVRRHLEAVNRTRKMTKGEEQYRFERALRHLHKLKNDVYTHFRPSDAAKRGTPGSGDSEAAPMDESETETDEPSSDDDEGQNRKAGMLDSKATLVFKEWMYNHFDSPYPTDADKKHLAMAAGDNVKPSSVNYWFINARVRMMRPMMFQMVDLIREDTGVQQTLKDLKALDKAQQQQQQQKPAQKPARAPKATKKKSAKKAKKPAAKKPIRLADFTAMLADEGEAEGEGEEEAQPRAIDVAAAAKTKTAKKPAAKKPERHFATTSIMADTKLAEEGEEEEEQETAEPMATGD